jgi:hypothetical protein
MKIILTAARGHREPKPHLRPSASNNNPTIVFLPTVTFNKYFGMRNGRDCWAFCLCWLRIEVGISWHGEWPRKNSTR